MLAIQTSLSVEHGREVNRVYWDDEEEYGEVCELMTSLWSRHLANAVVLRLKFSDESELDRQMKQ